MNCEHPDESVQVLDLPFTPRGGTQVRQCTLCGVVIIEGEGWVAPE